ncbi:hypothetical protein DAPPUDRAFT_315968 [Daphnia pulex]|uniref:Thrombospondin-like N-terminal domain-containing protein n=1 Tax=Daphnia pulex TaxID=6669 RepID=E9GBB4_DAPPU|nr:hypothetical protein DAPPUDRAFT_315968 [Daphnia pulex]|eukprot:EFX83190.1 hypothetical protein DAPPUDRAFT_315968 [Daphnia pulex]
MDGEPIHHDLLKAIEVPLRDEEHITFGTGVDGFPAFVLFRGHDIKIPYKVLLPDKLYSDFSILVTIKPDNNEGGYLFAVVDPLETLVQFGLRIGPAAGPGQSELSLYHTHPEDRFVSKVLAKFLVPNFAKKWTRFAFRVLDSGLGVPNVTLFFNCIEYGSLLITSVAWKEQLTFDTASTLYIGQAGGLLQPPGEFVVTKTLKTSFLL